jgi:hypothetical protein
VFNFAKEESVSQHIFFVSFQCGWKPSEVGW